MFAIFFVMLIISLTIVPAVSAKADLKTNSQSVVVLKDSKTETILSFKAENGNIGYITLWNDQNDENKTYFTISSEKELLSITNTDNSISAVSKMTTAKASKLSSGSYIKKTSTGLLLHLSSKDANGLAGNYSILISAIANIIAIKFNELALSAIVISTAICLIVHNVYWRDQNSNGSIDVRVSFKDIALAPLKGYLRVQVGKHFYPVLI
jgi:hypothetical protein